MIRNSVKNVKLLSVIATCLLLTSAFVVIPAFSVQPAIDTSTYYVGTIGQPARLDPGRAYDTASGELIQNVYQPLIWFGDKHVLSLTSGGDYNMTPADHASLDASVPGAYVPVIATALPTITNSNIQSAPGIWGLYWTFTLNSNAAFQNWIDHAGDTRPRRNVTVDDVVYSFQVQMVVDSYYAPVWMFETPAFNIMTFDQLYIADSGPYGNGFNVSRGDEAAVANRIKQWCFAGDPQGNHTDTMVTFNFSYPLPRSAMYQIFAQTWGSIVNKDFMIEHGCWNYSWYNGWSADYRRMPDGSGNRTPIDRYYPAKSLYTAATPTVGTDIPDMCGTGPYKYNYGDWNMVNKQWKLDYDPNYWMGWGNAGDKSGNYIHTIIEKGIDTWPTRKMLFLEGEFDVAVVPRANMYDLLQGTDKYKPLAGLTLVTNITELVNEEIFFCFNVSGDSAYQSYVGYPTHLTSAEPYFFNNTAIRLAFAYALNYTQVIQQAWYGEALQQASWWVDGLVPASSKNLTLSTHMRSIDLTMMQHYLAQAMVDGYNISQVGFETTLVYNTGNDQRRIELQAIANAFAQLGTKYKVNVVSLDWPVFLDNLGGMGMPVFCLGWLADYADPSDWAMPYQQSAGSFMISQGPPFPADQFVAGPPFSLSVDDEIAGAATESNATRRDLMYQDLQYKYYMDVPSIPVVQPIGRRFARDWVQGWYYNDLLPGLYAYDLYKSAPTTYQPVDVTVTITPIATYPRVYVSMGQMKQLYGGGALARMTFQVVVKRNDANGNVSLLPVVVSLERFNLTDLTTPAAVYPSLIGPPWANPGPPSWFVWFNGTPSTKLFIPCQSPVYLATAIVSLGPGGNATLMLTWYEDGVTSALPANATWGIAAVVSIAQTDVAYDNNSTNNCYAIPAATYNCTAITTTIEITQPSLYYKYRLLMGDINEDGIVNFLDAIVFNNCFGKSSGEPGFNQLADLDGNGVININDAILFAGIFGQKIVSDP